MCQLLLLPAEIRSMIWDRLLPHNRRFVLPTPRHEKSNDRHIRPDTNNINDIGSIWQDLLVLSQYFAREVSETFYRRNCFCLDLRAADTFCRHMRDARFHVCHLQLFDQLDFRLPLTNTKDLISQFPSLQCISVCLPTEPCLKSKYELNLHHRSIDLRVLLSLIDDLEQRRYSRLRLVYDKLPLSRDQEPDQLMTIKILRHARSPCDYYRNSQTGLWLRLLTAWILGGRKKQDKLSEVFSMIDLTFERSFLALKEKEIIGDEHGQGNAIVLTRPRSRLACFEMAT